MPPVGVDTPATAQRIGLERIGLNRIGLMGGTFDPIHLGHLFIAEEARVRCHLDRVIFSPNNQPPPVLGKSTHADAETRLALTQLAIEGNAQFCVSRVELDRPGPSYAFDTLNILRHEFGPKVELFYIMGADSISEILTWYRGAELFSMCRFIAATRPGFSLEQARRQLSPEQLQRVQFLEVPGLHIASRDLRERVRQGLPIRYLTPDAVARAIEEHGLYREGSNHEGLNHEVSQGAD
jgi:nicotinate-nucleotide adenylyltransferase